MKTLSDTNVERSLIGAIVGWGEMAGVTALDRAEAVGVTASTFTDDVCRKMFAAAKKQAAESGLVDFTVVCSTAGVAYEEAIRIYEGHHIASYAEVYATELVDYEKRRKLEKVCLKGIEKSKDMAFSTQFTIATVEADLASIERGSAGRSGGGSIKDLLSERRLYFREALDRGYGGLLTRHDWIDKSFGGLSNGRVYIVSGGPGSGKTTLVRNIAVDMAGRDVPTAVATLEIPPNELAAWMVCGLAGISMRDLDLGNNPAAVQKFETRTKDFEMLPITVEGGPMTPSLFQSWARRQVNKGAKLVCLDYIQLLQPDAGGKELNMEQQVAHASNTVLQTALSLNIPILAIASESNAGTLRHSGQLSYDCAGHIRLEKREDGSGPVAKFMKCRHGANTDGGLNLYFNRGRLDTVSPEETNWD